MKAKIQAVSAPKEHEGKLQIGFLVPFEGVNKWFNIAGNPEELDNLLKTIIQKGNLIEFDNELGQVSNLKLLEAGEKDIKDDLVNFEELLARAHEKAKEDDCIFCIQTELVSYDFEKKTALFKARVIAEDDTGKRVFEAHGDATQENIQGSFVKPHYIRMAETRAIARALRWYTNNACCSDVETENGKVD